MPCLAIPLDLYLHLAEQVAYAMNGKVLAI
jgi:hypothetical protein